MNADMFWSCVGAIVFLGSIRYILSIVLEIRFKSRKEEK